jgi:hypothetical protein
MVRAILCDPILRAQIPGYHGRQSHVAVDRIPDPMTSCLVRVIGREAPNVEWSVKICGAKPDFDHIVPAIPVLP